MDTDTVDTHQKRISTMKLKRVFAIIAVILLVGLYGSTLVFALSDSPNAAYLFKASIFCTVIIPVMLYGYMIIYRIFDRKSNSDQHQSDESTSDD